ncbi:hypothetical protein FRC06_009975 [Ceratobasidium sp. 370]|nr:hypothetical protein FRC06_009975 [Ceratobasidium sp. 370]
MILQICHLIKSYKFDNPKVANLKADENANSYCMDMRMMQEVVQEISASLPVVQVNIGVEQEVDHEMMLKIKAILGDDVPDIDEWAGMLQQKGKGKGSSQAQNNH